MSWMKYALKEAEKSYDKDEVPVGCVLVKDDKIIAKGHNKREANNDIFGHAEIICIKKAAKRLKTWKLNGTILYVTLEPCRLCEVAIKESRIDKVVFLTQRLEHKKDYNKTIKLKVDNLVIEKEYKALLHNFFNNKRKGE